jgi:hypothetical protein
MPRQLLRNVEGVVKEQHGTTVMYVSYGMMTPRRASITAMIAEYAVWVKGWGRTFSIAKYVFA